MAGVAITLDVGPAPQGGQSQILCSSPASETAFKAASAVGPNSAFVEVVTVADINGNTQTKLLQISKILEVVGT
jgi:hypothetical protein